MDILSFDLEKERNKKSAEKKVRRKHEKMQGGSSVPVKAAREGSLAHFNIKEGEDLLD
jgi:hypothetical protein